MKLFGLQVRTIDDQVADSFVMDFVGPAGAKQLRLGNVQHEASQPRAIENVRINEGRKHRDHS